MAIRFKCTNLVRFDPETGQYVKCGQELSVDESRAAETVTCPECGNEVEVPFGVSHSAQTSLTQETQAPKTQGQTKRGQTTQAQTTKSVARPGGRQPQAKTSDRPTVSHSQAAAANVAQAAVAAGSISTSPAPGSIDDSVLETESRVLQYASFDPKHTCLSCGGLVKPGMKNCPTCGAARRVLDDERPLESFEVKPAGLQLWWRGTMTSDPSRGAFVKLVSFVIVWFASCIIVISIFFLGIFNFIISAPVVIATVGYFLALSRLKRMSKTPGLPLAGWQRTVWNLMVPFFRALNWRFAAFPNPVIFTQRGQDFTGVDMHDHPSVQTHNVLDLAGCRFGDEELKTLRHTKHLTALVLIGTQVSHEGIFRLQQETPRTWIWY